MGGPQRGGNWHRRHHHLERQGGFDPFRSRQHIRGASKAHRVAGEMAERAAWLIHRRLAATWMQPSPMHAGDRATESVTAAISAGQVSRPTGPR